MSPCFCFIREKVDLNARRPMYNTGVGKMQPEKNCDVQILVIIIKLFVEFTIFVLSISVL
jgi:hypothetical protein